MHADITDTIGTTPAVRLQADAPGTLVAKLESFNPGGSAKDRPARAMIDAAVAAGELAPGERIVEATSGNTGIGLAMVGAARGYAVTIVMPADKSPERRRLMAAYGADIELVDGDIQTARDRAAEIAATGAVRIDQFTDTANPTVHYETTGPELLEQVGPDIDAFVAGVGTGGTLSGIGRRLRERLDDVEIVAVEPAANAVLSTGEAGADAFQGMGPGFVSPNLDRSLIDTVETVSIEDATAECRRLARAEGILAGQSSGGTSVAAQRVADRIDNPTATIVMVFWDSGERYLSTGLFD